MSILEMKRLSISAFTASSALGLGKAAHAKALRDERTGLNPQLWEDSRLATWVGEAPGVNEKLRGGFHF